MHRKFLYNIIVLLFVALAFTSCEKESGEEPASLPVEVAIRASHATATRTSLDVVGDGSQGSEQGIRWSVGDQIRIWAKTAEASGYKLNGTLFKLATYNSTFDDADFLASGVEKMRPGEYNYYGFYPAPDASNVNGTQVTFTLPTQQSGSYDPTLDAMVASATGRELVPVGESYTGEEMPKLSFKPLFHLIRIRIPEGANLLGYSIKRLEITFPCDVVGTAKVDVTNPNNIIWGNCSNKITVDITDPNCYIDEGSNYVWLHIKPGEIKGDITFKAYNVYGVPSETISTPINKDAKPQHITPIALTIPESSMGDVTYIDIKEKENNLGEAWNTMTFSGQNFIVPFEDKISNTMVIDANDKKLYKFAILASASTLANQSLNMVYDSPNTNFSHTVKLGTPTNGKFNVEQTVPYLLEEDFSRIKDKEESNGDNTYNEGNEKARDGVSLTQLPDWNASRFWAKSGAIRLNMRYQEVKIVISFASYLFGRLDSPQIPKLKEGKTVSVCVKFDAGAYPHPDSGYDIYSTSIVVATHTNNSNPINGMAEGSTGLTSSYSAEDGRGQVAHKETILVNNIIGGEAFGGPFEHYSTKETINVNSNTRLCFYPVSDHETGGLTNCETNVYLDNIKVSIAN